MERGCVNSEWSDTTEVCLAGGKKSINGVEQREKDPIIVYVSHTKQAWHGESEANEWCRHVRATHAAGWEDFVRAAPAHSQRVQLVTEPAPRNQRECETV